MPLIAVPKLNSFIRGGNFSDLQFSAVLMILQQKGFYSISFIGSSRS